MQRVAAPRRRTTRSAGRRRDRAGRSGSRSSRACRCRWSGCPGSTCRCRTRRRRRSASRSPPLLEQRRKCGEPHSSSPSTRKLRVTGGRVAAGRLEQRAQPEQVERRPGPCRRRRRGRPARRRGSCGSNGGVCHSSSRVDRLDVVVAVDDDGRRLRIGGRPLGEHGRQRRPVGQTSTVGKPVRRSASTSQSAERRTSLARSGSAGDRRDAQPVDEVGQELVAMRLDVVLDRGVRHAANPRRLVECYAPCLVAASYDTGRCTQPWGVSKVASSSRDSSRSGRFTFPVRT